MHLRLLLAVAFLLGCSSAPKSYSEPKSMVVIAPVANVRAKPVAHTGEYEYDPLQETQIERGEPVLVLGREGEWVRVEVPEQLEFTHNQKWEGYPGWVRREALSSNLEEVHQLKRLNLPSDELREKILKNARLHIGDPYLWGGRSKHDPHNKEVATGVDCSGLVNRSFRQVGWFIPRDSHEQYLRSQPVSPAKLKKGDLVFFAKKENPAKVVHVGFYAGEEKMLEAPHTGEKVREISFKERLGVEKKEMDQGFKTETYVLYFGTFFPED